MTTPNLQNSENKLKTIVETGKPGKISIRAADGTHKQVYISKQTINKLKPALETYDEKVSDQKTGGLFPLLALLPVILAGVGSAAGIAGGVASAVNNAKQAAPR